MSSSDQKRKKTQAERQREVDAQLAAMKQAIGDDDWSDSDSADSEDDSTDSEALKERSSKNAMESARKFLWDETDDDDDHLYLGGPFPKKPKGGSGKHSSSSASSGLEAARANSGANMFRPNMWESHRSVLDDSINLHDGSDLRAVSGQAGGGGGNNKKQRQSITDMFFRGRSSTSSLNKKKAPPGNAKTETSWYDADGRDADDALDRKVNRKNAWSYLACLWNTVLWAILLSLFYVFGYYIYDFVKTLIPEKPVRVDATEFLTHSSAVQQELIKNGVLVESALEDPNSPQAIALQWLAEDTLQTHTKSKDPYLAQRYALAVFYHVTNGMHWANSDGWLTNQGYCQWYGVQCLGTDKELVHHHDNGPIFELSLSSNQVKGSIPVELNAFDSLFFLDLQDNQLDGTLPEELGGWTALRMFSIAHNELYGSIPVKLLNSSPDLHILNAAHNGLTGTIPPELGSATKLRELRLEYNSLYGHIPDSVRDLDRLETLSLASNKLGGSLPNGIFDMARLESLHLHDNSLTGHLSNNFASLSHLEILTLNHNQLVGTVPNVFSSIKFLQEFQLQANELTGTIPRSVCSLATERKLSYLSATCTHSNLEGELGVHCDCCTECK